jgi:ribonucleotide monophosphatase NagD (HAD superfamily)
MSVSSHIDNALLIDLDGVIYQGDRPIAGAVDSLDWTTSRSRAALLEKFIGLGFEAQLDELMTPIVAANQWLDTQQMRRIAAFVSPGALVDFDGVEIIPPERDEAVDAVVIGDLGDAWDYQMLNRAFRLLMQDPAPQLIALGMTRYWRSNDGLRLDVAPFIKALEHGIAGLARLQRATGIYDWRRYRRRYSRRSSLWNSWHPG